MSTTTLDQLKNLTNAQLCIMCHDFKIKTGFVTPENRRRLERKLLTAIIEKRAKHRAQEEIRREHADYNRRLQAYHMNNHDPQFSDPTNICPIHGIRRATYAIPHAMNHLNSLAPNVNVHYYEQPSTSRQPHQYRQGLNHTKNALASTSDPPIHSRIPLNSWRYPSGNFIAKRDNRNTAGYENHMSEIKLEAQSKSDLFDNYEVEVDFFGEMYDESETQDFQQDFVQAMDHESYSTCKSCSSSFDDLNMRDYLVTQTCSKSNLKSAPCLWWQQSVHTMTTTKKLHSVDSTISFEQELHCINYLSFEQEQKLLAEKTPASCAREKELLNLVFRNTHIDIQRIEFEDSSVSVAQNSPRRYQYLFNLICCNQNGKVLLKSLGYTILCCSIAACLFIVIKLKR